MTATTTPRILTQVTVTERYPTGRTGQMQAWAAVSGDGVWIYNRIEDTGTAWSVGYVPTRTDCGLFASLPKARRATRDGSALAAAKLPVATRRSPGQPELTADDEYLYRREQED